jgi:hypothetical protein
LSAQVGLFCATPRRTPTELGVVDGRKQRLMSSFQEVGSSRVAVDSKSVVS